MDPGVARLEESDLDVPPRRIVPPFVGADALLDLLILLSVELWVLELEWRKLRNENERHSNNNYNQSKHHQSLYQTKL